MEINVEERLNELKNEVLNNLREYIRLLQREYKQALNNADPIDLARTHIFYHNTMEEIEGAIDYIHKYINLIKDEELPKLFKDRGLKTQPIANLGKSVGFRTSSFWSFKDKDQGFHWLRTHQLGSIIKTDVHTKTLTKSLNEYRDATGEDPPDNIFNTYDKYTTVVTKLSASNTPRGRKKADG